MCSIDIDNHEDTHYFGSNIQPLLFTSQYFPVAPFLEYYYEQLNISISTGATSYTMELEEVIILIFGQGLWFVNRMENI